MKTKKKVSKNEFRLDFSTNFKKIVPLFLLVFTFYTTSCKSDVELNSDLVYGLSFARTLNLDMNEPDSIVQIDLSKGIYKNLCSTDKFEGLSSAFFKAYSKNLNMIVYFDPMVRKIGLIHLDNLTSETIDLKTDSTYKGVKSLAIIENKNLLVLFTAHYNYADKSHSLDIVEINLITKNINSISKLMDFDYSQIMMTTVDKITNRIFLVPNYLFSNRSDKLYIYNFESKELTTKLINADFDDVHFSATDQCLIGSTHLKEGIGLLSYSINNQKTDTIGSYNQISGFVPDMSYFDQQRNSYWLGILPSNGLDFLKLTNISMSNASFSNSFTMPKFMYIIN